MEALIACTRLGAKGWKGTPTGTCFTGKMAKQNAYKERAAKKAEEIQNNLNEQQDGS